MALAARVLQSTGVYGNIGSGSASGVVSTTLSHSLSKPFFIALILLAGACCDRSSRRIPPYFDLAEEFEFRLQSVSQRSGDVLSQASSSEVQRCRGGWLVNQLDLTLCVVAHRSGYWLTLENKTRMPVVVAWPDARFVDENGDKHPLYRFPLGEVRPPRPEVGASLTLAPGQKVRDAVSPLYKSYWAVEDCKSGVWMSEPLVPTTLTGRTVEQMRNHVRDLAARQVPVKLMIPVVIDGTPIEFTFSFVLHDRWAVIRPPGASKRTPGP